MKTIKHKTLLLTLIVALAFSGLAFAEQVVYPIKAEHKGGDVTPLQAYDMLKKDQGNTFLVDVRTRHEYQDIGHPNGAYNIPYKFYTNNVGKKGYTMVLNENFGNDLKKRFNPETDTLLLLCRSGGRSVAAATAAVDAGFKAENVYSVMGGFEGDKVKDKQSPFYGMRQVGGWRLENLPWTYKMDPKLMYQPDIQK